MVVRLWLGGKRPNTVAAYEADARRFLALTGKTIAAITLNDLQLYDAGMADARHATRTRRLAAVRSLLSFATRYGAIPSNPGALLKIEKADETKVERILTESEVLRMIGAETDARKHALLRLIYTCGLRASEAAGLRWRDMSGNEKRGGEARILGKGAKLRTVEIPPALWRELAALTPAITADSPVVPGRDGGPLDRAGVFRAVKRAAKRAGVTADASPHWLRHSHATHALDHGCKLPVLQKALGHASIQTTAGYLHVKPGEGSASFIRGG